MLRPRAFRRPFAGEVCGAADCPHAGARRAGHELGRAASALPVGTAQSTADSASRLQNREGVGGD